MDIDCIIVGGGLAGLVCANRVAQLGRKPLILEQGAEVDYACNSRFSGGILHVAFKDMRAPVGAVESAVRELAGNDSATRHAGVLAANGEVALEWLRGEGTKFVKGGALEFMRWILAPPRPRRPGLDWKGRGPDVMLRNLTSRLGAIGGEVRRGVRVRNLVRKDGAICGVVADTSTGEETILAPTVVIADGGFQGNEALVREHICDTPSKLFPRGAGTSRGDGLEMAIKAGAATVGLNRFYGHLLGRGVFENESLWPYPTVDAIAQAALLLDGDGMRFTDEGRGGVYMANAVAKLDDPFSAVAVFDEGVWTGIAADNRYPPCMNPSFERVGGEVLTAPSIDALAAQLEMSPERLAQTVSEHNDGAAVGQSTPARTRVPVAPQPLVSAPFRAIRVCAGMTYTMGGIAVDTSNRVVGVDGAPMRGLYAIGSASGGMEGGENAVYLGGLAKAVVTGLQAAEAMVG
jgi:fumarate reductase flavoprotein subunit